MNTKRPLFGIFAFLGVFLFVIGVAIASLSAWFPIMKDPIVVAENSPASSQSSWTLTPSSTAEGADHTSTIAPTTQPSSTPSVTPGEVISNSQTPSETLLIFENTTIPINDPIELAERFNGLTDIPTRLETPLREYQLNDQDVFWLLNTDDNRNFQIQATLRYITDHAYFWIEDGITYDPSDAESLMQTFESHIYPTNHANFGSEWSPGVDADAHIFILYARNMGNSVAGYFSPLDEFLPAVYEYSNTHEMVFLNADKLMLSAEYTYTVLAHEHQHMIQWNLDRNEETWVFEGMANLAAFLNGYGVGGIDHSYAQNPDLQLNYWAVNPRKRFPHYGASFLFLDYFYDRLGISATQELVANPAKGISGVDAVLGLLSIPDGVTGEPITADDIFADWEIANFLHDGKVADGRYTYNNYPDAPKSYPTETIETCPSSTNPRDVSQYGVDYIRINCKGNYSLQFQGSTEVNALPINPYSGEYAFYSNHGDVSAMTLSQKFDFRDHSGPLTFSYWTWFDIEQDYDYAYVTASLDGINWQILTTPSGTADDPVGNNQGWGYTGLSGALPGESTGARWIHESIDISQFAGQQVWLAFEYYTDSAVYSEGFLVDDIAIPEIDYFSDFEGDAGGWQPDGFVRIQNILPQKYRVALILVGEDTKVEEVTLNAQNQAVIPLNLDNDNEYVVLVVSGITRFTRQKAVYEFTIQ